MAGFLLRLALMNNQQVRHPERRLALLRAAVEGPALRTEVAHFTNRFNDALDVCALASIVGELGDWLWLNGAIGCGDVSTRQVLRLRLA